jgi:hypothetical protein
VAGLPRRNGWCSCNLSPFTFHRFSFTVNRLPFPLKKGPGDLMPEILREFLIAIEAEFDIAAAFRDVGRTKEIIPEAEGDAEIHPVLVVRGQRFGVMPDVHLRIVENVFQGAIGPVEVGVVDVADEDGKGVDNKEILNAEADHGERNILDGFVLFLT